MTGEVQKKSETGSERGNRMERYSRERTTRTKTCNTHKKLRKNRGSYHLAGRVGQ